MSKRKRHSQLRVLRHSKKLKMPGANSAERKQTSLARNRSFEEEGKRKLES